MEGDVTVAVEHSTVNYKDGLAITGKAPIIRKFPLIPGIDFAGTCVARPILTGSRAIGSCSMAGASAKRIMAAMPDWPAFRATGWCRVPDSMTTADAMAIGTAGYTAMLCVMALEEQGVKPADGEVLVTGAAGGVGSIAIVILAKLGFKVVASTGRLEETDYLKSLGAAAVIDRNEFDSPVKPLAKSRWAAAIDSVGSITLANVISQINPEGTVAACGLAQGMDLPTSVAPFILRGVKLIGVNSVTCPNRGASKPGARLAADLDLAQVARALAPCEARRRAAHCRRDRRRQGARPRGRRSLTRCRSTRFSSASSLALRLPRRSVRSI